MESVTTEGAKARLFRQPGFAEAFRNRVHIFLLSKREKPPHVGNPKIRVVPSQIRDGPLRLRSGTIPCKNGGPVEKKAELGGVFH